jgi:guanine deaminase
LTEPEEDLVLAQQAGISHCPNSNFSLLSGMCPVRRFLNKGIKVGLGTDVSGGTVSSPFLFLLFPACACAVAHVSCAVS